MICARKILIVVMLVFVAGEASAIISDTRLSARLTGPTPLAGGEIGFDLWVETDADPVLSGGVTLGYERDVLSFVGFQLLVAADYSLLPATPYAVSGEDTTLCGSLLSGCVAPLRFGVDEFADAFPAQVGGGIKIGTFRFLHLGGASDLILGEDAAAPFINANIGGAFSEVSLSGAAVVPLPPAAWLMISGLALLSVFGVRGNRALS